VKKDWKPQCIACGGGDLLLAWQEFENGTRRVRADCRRCQTWVAFLPRTPANVAAADGGTSRSGALDTLILADALGVEIFKCERSLFFDPKAAPPPLPRMAALYGEQLLRLLPRSRRSVVVVG
jgi:hypothetical protein